MNNQIKEKKRILLISPPFYRLMGSHFNGLNLGLSYIAAVLQQQGHEVRIYNADYLDTDSYLNQREIFQHYGAYKEALNDLNHPIWEEVSDAIKAFSLDVVGISVYTAAIKSSKNIARMIKAVNEKILVIVGGPHPTLDAEGTLQCQDFDLAIRGEGEENFLELLSGKETQSILGLSYRKGTKIIHNPDRPFIENLDSIPLPSRDLFWNNGQGLKKLDLGYILTGRGCPFCCTFCASPAIWKRKTRFRSVESVLREIEMVLKDNPTTIIYFVDDTFTLKKDRAKEICRQIIERGYNFKWKCDTRADCLDEELVKLMKWAGCICAKIGVESGSERIIKQIKKNATKEVMMRAARLIKAAGISLTVYLMAGFPGETDADLRETIEFAKELQADYYSLSVLAPYYGTEIYEEVKDKLDKEHWEYFFHQSGDMILNDGLSLAVVDEFLKLNETVSKGARI